jgi:hypothetical protein
MMNTPGLDHQRSRTALRTVKLLISCHLGVSVVTILAIGLLRKHPALVTPTVWIRAAIVVIGALLMTTFASRAAHGASRAYLRLRIMSAVMVVAIAVVIAIPGSIPLWMKTEQGFCGVLLLCVVFFANGKHLRSSFATRSMNAPAMPSRPAEN